MQDYLKTLQNPQTHESIHRETLSQEYQRRFMKQNMTLTIPRPPVKMEWFEEDELAKVLFEIINTEMELERVKQMISLKTDFNIAQAYATFDLTGSGFVTRLQFEEVCNLYKQYPKTYELQLLWLRYDKDKDGKLSFQEFCDMILPVTPCYNELVMTRKGTEKGKSYPRGECFLRETQQQFDRLLQLLILTETRCESLR